MRPYQFAFFTAFYITLLLILGGLIWGILVVDSFDWTYFFLFALVIFIISFTVVQLRVRYYLNKRIQSLYDDLSLLEGAEINPTKITTDMESLTQEVSKFASRKKLEIESLRVRETYRKEFMGNVAHELKTPLFTVQGYILTLLDGAIKDKTVRKKYLQRADKAVERLIFLVNDLDMITKLEVGDLNLDYSYFDIVETIKNTFDLLELKAAKKNITLTFDTDYEAPILVNADQERIQQSLTNLIENSLKYGSQDGTTEVSFQALGEQKIMVRITDNGEGIGSEHIPRLFERFYRVDKSGNRKVGGSGLGLSIVKHIIEAHDERIFVESELGVGSEFSFTLERAEPVPSFEDGIPVD